MTHENGSDVMRMPANGAFALKPVEAGNWWDDAAFNIHRGIEVGDVANWLLSHAVRQTLPAGQNSFVTQYFIHGYPKKKTSFTNDIVNRFIEVLHARVVFISSDASSIDMVWPRGSIELGPECGVSISAIFHSPAEEKSFAEFVDSLRPLYTQKMKVDPITPVSVIVPSMTGITVQNIPVKKQALVRENYASDVVEAFDHVVEDMNAEDPCGRFIILDGPAGTGKTHIVNSLLHVPQSGHTLMFPPGAVEALQNPEFQALLLRLRGHTVGPILLVLEDADHCLAERKASNMNAISTLLNLSDGLLGKMLNLRIVATTNTPKADFDQALLRPGRCCRHINVSALPPVQANKIFERLTGKKGAFKGGTTLARVYEAARNTNGK